MTHSSYKNGALKEAHCTMNKQIGVKNTETLTRYHEKRQERGAGWEGRAYQHRGQTELKRGANLVRMEKKVSRAQSISGCCCLVSHAH